MTKTARAAKQKAQSAARSASPGTVLAWQGGKPAFAKGGLKAALLSNPSDRAVPSVLKEIAHEFGRRDKAESAHRQSVGTERADPIALCNLGIALQRGGQHAEAAKQLRA